MSHPETPLCEGQCKNCEDISELSSRVYTSNHLVSDVMFRKDRGCFLNVIIAVGLCEVHVSHNPFIGCFLNGSSRASDIGEVFNLFVYIVVIIYCVSVDHF